MDWEKEQIDIVQFEKDLLILSSLIAPCKKKYKYIFGIPRGGLIVAVWLSHQLQIPYIPHLYLPRDPNILIVDDIADTGQTLSNLGLDPFYDTATLYYKKRSIVKPTYYARETNNWIIFPYERIDEPTNRKRDIECI